VGFGGDEDGARNRTGAAVLFASDKSLISPTGAGRQSNSQLVNSNW